MPTIYIDDKAYEVDDGDNVLQAALGLGLDLPYFCWHPAMGSVGACRQCALVQFQDENDTRGRIVMGCMTPVSDGARFSLSGDDASEFRKNIVESLMLNHPHDCPVCAEGGECHLQDMTVMVGHRDRRYRGRKNTHRNQYLGPLINHEMNRCITCYRCTRYYQDYAGGADLSAQAARDHIYFGRQQEGVLESEFAGNLVEVCPTGVFTDRALVSEYTRKWDLQSAPSVCTGCGLGCNIMPGERYGKLKRIHNRYNHQVNGYFLCDRGRFGSGFVNSDKRLSYAGRRNDAGSYDAIDKSGALELAASWCGEGASIAAIGSPRASLETNYLLRRLVEPENFCTGIADDEAGLVGEIRDLLRTTTARLPSLREVESADAILVLGEDVTNTSPRLALSLRQSVRNRALEVADAMHLPHWQDAAIRNAAQDQLSPMYIAGVAGTRLDDVAEKSVALAPDDIARLGAAIASRLGAKNLDTNDLDGETAELADEIANSLTTAKQPLVISGTGCQHAGVVQAAAAIAASLAGNNDNAMMLLCVPEANSLGASLLDCEDPSVSLEALTKRAADGGIDVLLVAENDLYRRAASGDIDMLLDKAGRVVVIDALENATMEQADLVIPASTYAEAEGTLVSNEGRAQRYYPVFQPADDRQAAWRWIRELGAAIGREGFVGMEHFDQVAEGCAAQTALLANMVAAAPEAEFRDHGLKVPRQPHRYSGRTAVSADISVHEPKQPEDEETPLSYSMEGVSGTQPGALLSYVWSPGWNSNQSLHKFQDEVGGPLAGGTPGVRLIEPDGSGANFTVAVPGAHAPDSKGVLVVPVYRIFGSEELSVHSDGIAELAGEATLEINPADAARLGVADGGHASVDGGTPLAVSMNPTLTAGCVGYPVGVPGAPWVKIGQSVILTAATVSATEDEN
jgi:NADH-quinone oxidoreductase subunit G